MLRALAIWQQAQSSANLIYFIYYTELQNKFLGQLEAHFWENDVRKRKEKLLYLVCGMVWFGLSGSFRIYGSYTHSAGSHTKILEELHHSIHYQESRSLFFFLLTYPFE